MNAILQGNSSKSDKAIGFGEYGSKKSIAYEILKERIIKNEYKPGRPINDSVLCEELGISKTPVREALQQLEREHLIETIAGRGSFVTHITLSDLREIFESREIIECGAARRAAMVKSKDLVIAKKKELETLDPGDHQEHEWNLIRDDVHTFIFRLLDNQRLQAIYTQLLDQIIRLRYYFSVDHDTERTSLYNQEHLNILDALIESNPDKAEAAVMTHLRNAAAYLTRQTSI